LIKVSFNPETYFAEVSLLVVRTDFTDTANLVDKLVNAADPVSNHLLDGFAPASRQTLNEFDGSDASLEAVKNVLLAELNQRLSGASLYEKKRFKNVVSKERDTLVGKLLELELSGDGLIAFNRLLLEEAYPLELKRSPKAEWTGWTTVANVATEGLLQEWSNWKKEWIAWKKKREQGEDPPPIEYFKPKLDDDIWKGIRDWLLQHIFHNKCAYCETAFVGFIGDAEHFRPKGEVSVPTENGKSGVVKVVDEENNEIPHPGYFWLCYKWQNLLPSCHLCNRYGGKKTLFPVGRSHVGVTRLKVPEIETLLKKMTRSPIAEDIFFLEPEDLDRREEPLLLHPYYDKPEEHIYFETGGMCAAWRGSKRGETSIAVYNLNEKTKVSARDKGQREGLQHYFAKLSAAKVDIEEWKQAARELREEYVMGERSYALAVFDFLHQRFEGTQFDPEVLLGVKRGA
jgi:hypothetical protein